METLVYDQHRSQYYDQSTHQTFDNFSSKGFKGISCRSFEVSAGNLEPPPFTNSSPERNLPNARSTPGRTRSDPIAISPRPDTSAPSSGDGEFSYSELWAGPAYSNSPPPSSLPIPKFSLRQKRSVSVDIPRSSYRGDLRPLAKSAPSSPTRASFSSATEDLRRILQLDVADT